MSAVHHSTLVLAQGTRPDLNVLTVLIGGAFLALGVWLFVMSFDDDQDERSGPSAG